MTKTKNLFDKYNLLIGLFVLGASLFGIWYQIIGKTPELTLDFLSVDELTHLGGTPNLQASFKYNNIDVSHLWKLTIRIKNTGYTTLIGKGQHSSLLEKSIPITFGDNFRVIDSKVTYNDAKISTERRNSIISINFEQWREDELAVISIYLESKDKIEKPFPEPTSRSLISGKIQINDLTSAKGTTKKQPKINFPAFIIKASEIIQIASLLSIIFILSLICFRTPFELYKRYLWEKNNRAVYNHHIENLEDNIDKKKLNNYMASQFKSNPEGAPTFIWTNFIGDKVKSNNVFLTTKENIVLFIASAIILTSLLVLIFGT